MLETLTSNEVSEILAAARLEPFGEERCDLRAAMHAMVTARAAGVKDVKLDDFLLKFGPEAERAQTPDEMDTAMLKIAALFDAKEAKGKP